MQGVLGILAIILMICYFFRWVLIVISVILFTMFDGLTAGILAGCFTWAILTTAYYITFVVVGYKILSG